MNKLPASAGWDWIRQGFELFRKQPGGFFMISVSNMLTLLVLSIVPVLGAILPVLLLPIFTGMFMLACLRLERKQRITPMLLKEGFRQRGVRTLLGVGLLYIIAAVIALSVSALADGGVFMKLATGGMRPDAKEVLESNAGSAMLLAMLCYLPALMALWFTTPLVIFQGMGLGKSLFFSFFAILRAAKSFLLFLFSWFGIFLLVTQLVMAIFGRTDIGISVLTIVYMVLTIVIQCSQYASYRQIFGTPPDEAPPV